MKNEGKRASKLGRLFISFSLNYKGVLTANQLKSKKEEKTKQMTISSIIILSSLQNC
jgi:hypothetical protein